MTYSLIWLPQLLRDWGVKVEEVPGWHTRGHGDIHPIRGVIMHHTAGPREGDKASLGTIVNGRPGLDGPLAQIHLSRSGIASIVAAGKASHAGRGQWPFPSSGIVRNGANDCTIGIEWENVGQSKYNVEPITPEADKAYHLICAAICSHMKLDPLTRVIGHREWAPSRKSDPAGINLPKFRMEVKTLMETPHVGVGEVGPPVHQA